MMIGLSDLGATSAATPPLMEAAQALPQTQRRDRWKQSIRPMGSNDSDGRSGPRSSEVFRKETRNDSGLSVRAFNVWLVGNESNPYPLTGSWHAGEWTSEVCEQLLDHLSALSRENWSLQEQAINANDWATVDARSDKAGYLSACWRELSGRLAECRAFAGAQWTVLAVHRSLRKNLLGSTLNAARDGTLRPEWREGLEMAADEDGSRRLVDFNLGGDVGADVAALVVHELGTMAPQPWEPYVAGGNWRVALEAWYRDSLQLHEWQWQQDAAVREWEPTYLHECSERFAATEAMNCHVRRRADIELSYRSGLAAGEKGPDSWSPGDPDGEGLPYYWTTKE